MTRRDKAEIVLACALLPPILEFASAAHPPQNARGVDRVLQAAPGFWHYTCLRRAVVLGTMLRRSGRDAEVVIGVRRAAEGGYEAHAWLRCEGVEPYLEPGPVTEFVELR